jgi:hypothetical protein
MLMAPHASSVRHQKSTQNEVITFTSDQGGFITIIERTDWSAEQVWALVRDFFDQRVSFSVVSFTLVSIADLPLVEFLDFIDSQRLHHSLQELCDSCVCDV